MAICKYCGEDITFRVVDGRATPIHINGNFCRRTGSIAELNDKNLFLRAESYLNPEAKCPECGDLVFFFKCGFGGSVYFDDVGWPWPKHACTDSSIKRGKAGHPKVRNLKSSVTLRDSVKNVMEIYTLENIERLEESVKLKFRREKSSSFFQIDIKLVHFDDMDILITDLQNAPSFLVHKSVDKFFRRVDFINARTQSISSFDAPISKIV